MSENEPGGCAPLHAMKTMDENWKMVPVEPTPEMWKAGTKRSGIEASQAALCWADMLAAAPTPPQEQSEAVEPVGYVTGDEMPEHRRAQLYPGVAVHPNAQLYTAHYSPAASQALRMAADVCDEHIQTRGNRLRELTAGEIKERIEAIIPPTSEQDSVAQSASESDQRKLEQLAWDDEFTAKRLRRVASKLGISVPESDEMLLACGGTVLGSIARHVDDLLAPPPTDTVTMTREEWAVIEQINSLWHQDTDVAWMTGCFEMMEKLRAIVAQHMPEVGK